MYRKPRKTRQQKKTSKHSNKQTNSPNKTKNKPKMKFAVRISNSIESVLTNGKIFRSSPLESDQCYREFICCSLFVFILVKFRPITKKLTILTVSADVVWFARTSVVVSLVKRSAGSTVLAGEPFTRTLERRSKFEAI